MRQREKIIFLIRRKILMTDVTLFFIEYGLMGDDDE